MTGTARRGSERWLQARPLRLVPRTRHSRRPLKGNPMNSHGVAVFHCVQAISTGFNLLLKIFLRRALPVSARDGRYTPAGAARARGGQNEAKTKPFCDAAGAIDGRAGLANRHCLQVNPTFQRVLTRRVRQGENYRTKPFAKGTGVRRSDAGRATRAALRGQIR